MIYLGFFVSLAANNPVNMMLVGFSCIDYCSFLVEFVPVLLICLELVGTASVLFVNIAC